MDNTRASYYVCGSCLGNTHEDCANMHEAGSCACNCQHSFAKSSEQEQRTVARATNGFGGVDGYASHLVAPVGI